MLLLQVMEDGDLEWHTLNTAYDAKDLKVKQRVWQQTEYPTATFRIIRRSEAMGLH